MPSGTNFTTLDEVERELHEDDLMICDAEKPMCIAGVFGGLHSGVTEHTTSIFLENFHDNKCKDMPKRDQGIDTMNIR